MSIDKAYIKSLPKESVLQLLAICVEVLQEDESSQWNPSEAERARIDEIVERYELGIGKSLTKEEFRRHLDNLVNS